MKNWIVTMNRRGARFDVEVIAATQSEAKKKAQQMHPDSAVVTTREKR